ncbi:hypothetical protein L6452_34854 [Arctium lappa]|uniref:Uncharacterized protein n=1 Tax=Arctium lappa TaxID=4217 RepID=A0ACB8YIL7_ARCLA|nr:hypothetical protein L6452_34854 [Arctium lappa]
MAFPETLATTSGSPTTEKHLPNGDMYIGSFFRQHPSRIWKIFMVRWLVNPILVYMSKVDGKFNFSPISVNFLTEVAKVIFALVVLLIQARNQKGGEKPLLSISTFVQPAGSTPDSQKNSFQILKALNGSIQALLLVVVGNNNPCTIKMSSAQYPFYIVKDENQDSIDSLQATYHHWEHISVASREHARLTKELLLNCESIEWQVLLRLPDGSLMEITKVYPLDAVFDNPEDVPEDVM